MSILILELSSTTSYCLIPRLLLVVSFPGPPFVWLVKENCHFIVHRTKEREREELQRQLEAKWNIPEAPPLRGLSEVMFEDLSLDLDEDILVIDTGMATVKVTNTLSWVHVYTVYVFDMELIVMSF